MDFICGLYLWTLFVARVPTTRLRARSRNAMARVYGRQSMTALTLNPDGRNVTTVFAMKMPTLRFSRFRAR